MIKNKILVLIISFFISGKECIQNITLKENTVSLNLTRRILKGIEVGETRPYMVYLRPAPNAVLKEPNWLCGGVIIHPQYILTSAACIEDVQQFYVISGTHKWLPRNTENDCIKNGAKKAVWKCVPKDYVFDGKAFDNIRWMENDIAVVKVDSDFDFNRRIRGCDFKPSMIAFNDRSEDLESSGTVASIAGWGSVDKFDSTHERSANSPLLLETDVVLISKSNCKKRWPDRYHYIIDQNMICAKDDVSNDGALCMEEEINCKELVYSDEQEQPKARRFFKELPLEIHSARHYSDARRTKQLSGGFCENDHGGPLVGGRGKNSVVIGVISACMSTEVTRKCYGPFLYTSVWKYRNVINCAINKDKEVTCRRLWQSGKKKIVETHYNWTNVRSPNLLQDYVELLNAKTLPLDAKNILLNTNVSQIEGILNKTRRIINGEQSGNNRPYMVYLKLPTHNPKFSNYRRWLCGGVIVHEQYILTSAACIEDAKNFYVVSGTHSHNEEDDRYNNACIKNGAKKAVWKCIPRNYIFDGHENDNIRWMNNDIAIVKVEDDFDFTRRIRGCDFVPKPICYNNQTSRYESPGSSGIIAGWGSTDRYNDWVNQRSRSAQELLETSVEIISKETCKQRWGPRYHNVIDNYMICTRDTIAELSEACNDKYVECTDIMYSDEGSRRVLSPKELSLHSAHHNESGRRQQASSGGFCENDHGGPLIHGDGPDAVVIGIISACLVKERTNRCYGPFLYTSVYRNRVLIDCAIYKDLAGGCSKMFRSGMSYIEEELNWAEFNEGSTKGVQEEDKRRVGNITDEKLQANLKKSTSFDTIVKHEGVILRSFQDPLNKANTSTTNVPNKLS